MSLLDELSPPASGDIADRLAWAGDQISSLRDGHLSADVAGLLWALVVGWADLGSEGERRQYLEAAELIEAVMAEIREDL